MAECSLCLGDEAPLVPAPCGCKGTSGSVHLGCLRRWVRVAQGAPRGGGAVALPSLTQLLAMRGAPRHPPALATSTCSVCLCAFDLPEADASPAPCSVECALLHRLAARLLGIATAYSTLVCLPSTLWLGSGAASCVVVALVVASTWLVHGGWRGAHALPLA